MDRTKESLFNILQNHLVWEESSVLDLFSGTGNISLEAASRGALSVISVDQHPACATYIRKMSEELGFTQIKVYCKDVLKWYPSIPGSFDFIFLDPPYQLSGQTELVEKLLLGKWLNPGGILVLEHNPITEFAHLPGFTEMRKYGQSAFSFFTKPE
jgi:16S rRNA (guanine(966)-N(2))-methyltransferase RsmD